MGVVAGECSCSCGCGCATALFWDQGTACTINDAMFSPVNLNLNSSLRLITTAAVKSRSSLAPEGLCEAAIITGRSCVCELPTLPCPGKLGNRNHVSIYEDQLREVRPSIPYHRKCMHAIRHCWLQYDGGLSSRLEHRRLDESSRDVHSRRYRASERLLVDCRF